MRFFDKVQPGDYIVTPYGDRPLITANKKYKVIAIVDNESLYEIVDDSDCINKHDSGIFFEADTYWTCILMRIFSELLKIKLSLLINQ